MKPETLNLETTQPETAHARETENNSNSESVSSEVSVTNVEVVEIVENKSVRKYPHRGRKTILTDALGSEIASNVQLGLSMQAACKAAGVDHDSAEMWLTKGKGGVEPYATFLGKITEARHKAEAGMAAVVQRCATSDDERISLAAATWWLERRRPERWAKKDMNKVEVKQVDKLSDGELEDKIKKLAAARGWSGGEK